MIPVKQVTQKELAALLEVSPSTVSRALANDPRISDEIRARVQAEAARTGYRPNLLAAGFRKGSTRTIGLIVADISYPLYSGLARAVEDCAWEQGYNVILCDSDGTPEKEAMYLEVLHSRQVDGILMTPLTDRSGPRRLLSSTALPHVLIDVCSAAEGVSTVGFDHSKAIPLAVRHLVDCGHTRIALITGSHDLPQFRAMIGGYRQALTELCLPIHSALTLQLSFKQQLRMEGGAAAIERLLSLKPSPTAAIFSSDYNAVGALQVLARRQVRVPEDFAIIGYDDTPVGAVVTPALTTVSQDVYELGRIGTRILLHEIRTGPACTHQSVVLEPRLVVRQSTARA